MNWPSFSPLIVMAITIVKSNCNCFIVIVVHNLDDDNHDDDDDEDNESELDNVYTIMAETTAQYAIPRLPSHLGGVDLTRA